MAENFPINGIQRRACYKKTVDLEIGRKMREETTINIRKQKKDTRLKQKREGNADPCSHPDTVLPGIGMRKCSDQDVPVLISLLRSPVTPINVKVKATKELRRLSCHEGNKHLETMLESGILANIVSNMQFHVDYDERRSPEWYLAYESTWLLLNIAGEYQEAVVESGAISPLAWLLQDKYPEMRYQAALCLGNIAAKSVALRDRVLDHNVMEPLLRSIRDPTTMEEFDGNVWCVTQLCRGQPLPDIAITNQVVLPFATWMGKLIEINQEGSETVLENMLWTFSYLSSGNERQIETTMSSGVLGSLFKLSHNPRICTIPLARTLGNFASGNESQKQAVLDAGILKCMKPLLESSSVLTRKETFSLLSNIAKGNRQQAGLLLQDRVLFNCIVDAASNERMIVRKEALWTLINLCIGKHPHIGPLISAGGLQPLVEILKGGVEIDLKLAALDAIDAILKDGSSRPGEGYVHQLEECDGIDVIEKLQEDPSFEIYEKSVIIIEKYFGVEDEDENLAPTMNENGGYDFGLSSPPLPKTLQF